MQTINISSLKARLSACLQKVKAGETIVVLDRDTPVARLVPYRKSPGIYKLPLRPVRGKLVDLKLKIRLPIDPAEVIRRDREDA